MNVTSAELDATSLQQVCEDVSEMMLNVKLQPASFSFNTGEDVVSTCIAIVGETKHALFINCAVELADSIAASIFDKDMQQLETSEIHDALAEFTNIVAGGVIDFLRGDFSLGLPMVLDGKYTKIKVPHSYVVADCVLEYQGWGLKVTVTSV